jgi:hypothetical protein
MRRILVQRARHKRSLKGGGGQRRVDLDDVPIDTADSRLFPAELPLHSAASWTGS